MDFHGLGGCWLLSLQDKESLSRELARAQANAEFREEKEEAMLDRLKDLREEV